MKFMVDVEIPDIEEFVSEYTVSCGRSYAQARIEAPNASAIFVKTIVNGVISVKGPYKTLDVAIKNARRFVAENELSRQTAEKVANYSLEGREI